MADKQLDIFGNAVPRRVRPFPWKSRTFQPSLIPAELEAAANAEEYRAAMERFRDAAADDNNGPDPDVVGCETCDGFGWIDKNGNDCPDCHGLGYREDAPGE